MKCYVELREEMYFRMTDSRNVYRIIEAGEFEKYYSLATQEDKSQINILIEKLDVHEIRTWLKQQSKKHGMYDDLPIMDLREIGKSLLVKDYNILPKYTLISEIKKAEEAKRIYEEQRKLELQQNLEENIRNSQKANQDNEDSRNTSSEKDAERISIYQG